MIYKWVLDNIKGDRWIWFIALSLSILSLLVVYSATGSLAYQKMQGNTEYYLFKHFFLILLSFVAMWFTHKIDYKYFSQLSKISLYACIPLLLFTWKFGLNINDASRWINIPILNQAFQPSDLAKLSLIVYLSSYLSEHQMDIKNIKEKSKKSNSACFIKAFLSSPPTGGMPLLLTASALSLNLDKKSSVLKIPIYLCY